MTAALDLAAEHAALAAELRALGSDYPGDGQENDSYSGSGHPFFFVRVPDMRAIARAWLSEHRKTDAAEVLALAERLMVAGVYYEEKVLGALVLGYSAKARAACEPARIEAWLDHLTGWAEIDSLCASVFSAAEMGAQWSAWAALLDRLSRDANINKRRAALVFLCTPTRTSDDPRFRDLAFQIVERLKGEKPILITKVVSWLLRSMAPRHGPEVTAYLDANTASLPAIAVRETRAKLASGTKSGRPAKMRPTRA